MGVVFLVLTFLGLGGFSLPVFLEFCHFPFFVVVWVGRAHYPSSGMVLADVMGFLVSGLRLLVYEVVDDVVRAVSFLDFNILFDFFGFNNIFTYPACVAWFHT